jgi:glutathione S-transferase
MWILWPACPIRFISSPMILYAMDGCPYAHRTRALMEQLHQPVDLHLIDPRAKPPDFLAVTPNGKVPLLVDGDFKLYESFVINLYLSEKFAWKPAFSTDAGHRARERLAMLQFDEVIIAENFAFLRSGSMPAEPRLTALRNAIAEMDRTVRATGGVENLLGLHCGPHWLRTMWFEEERPSPVIGLVSEHAGLRRWLDDASRLPSVVATQPDRQKYLRDMIAYLDRRA